MEAAFQQVSKAEIFDYTGIQFMPINTLYQLLAMGQAKAPAFEIAQTFLMAPDLFNYWLTGEKVCEFSIASTSQCYDPRRDDWAKPMLEKLGIPSHIFPEVIPAGTVLGNLRPALAETINAPGATNLKVIAPACHDTGSAVVAVPADSNNFVYISSGTWSLMGTELNRPIINEASLAAGMTNEGGINGTFRLLKNIMGLWLVQECRRTWARTGEDYSYDDLAAMAEAAAPFQALIDPDYPDFLAPGDMPGRIRAYCQATGQIYPEDKGSLIRVILESLALKYRFVLEQLENLQGQTLNPIYIVGGGIQNQLLCQLAADATNRQVVTGPVEATAAGNIISQAIALGEIGSLAEGRQIIRNSFEITTLEPGDRTGWDDVYDRFLELVGA